MLGVEQSTETTISKQWEQLVQLIDDRLEHSQISLQCDITEILRMLFPEEGSKPLFLLLRLAQHSESISDEEVSTILSLHEVHGPGVPKTSTSTPSETRYYLRSIQLSVSDLRQVLQQYRARYFDHTYCDSLTLQIHDMKPDTQVWLRYIGCTFASTLFDRHMDDVVGGASPTRYSNFCSILRTTLGRPISTRVFEFTLLNLRDQQPGRPVDRGIVDSTEIFLIHLFGRHVLLNSKPGGYYQSDKPTEQEKEHSSTVDIQRHEASHSGSGHSISESVRTANRSYILNYWYRDQGVTSMFFMVKSKCDGHGRVRFRVMLDDGTMYAAPDGIYIGAKFKGTCYIDYDPDIYEHGLVSQMRDSYMYRLSHFYVK